MPDNVKIRMNPTFKADVIRAAEEKLGGKIITEKQALEALQRGDRLNTSFLARLSRKGLIKVSDITNLSTPPGQQELLFTGITESGRKVLES
jgi:hypothetical protein